MTDGNKPNNDTKELKPQNAVDALNRKYYAIFDELKEASPSLENCDEAFLCMVHNITEQYEAEYKQLFGSEIRAKSEREEKLDALIARFSFRGAKLVADKDKMPESLFALQEQVIALEFQKQYDLLAGEFDTEDDRKLAEQEALHERIVPNRNLLRRFLLFWKKPAQNAAADLVDIEANEKMRKSFAETQAKITMLTAERIGAQELAKTFQAQFAEYIEEQKARAQELAENAGNATDEQEGGQAESVAESASEGNSEGGEVPDHAEAGNPAETAQDRVMREYLNKKKKKAKDKQKDKSD